MPPVPESEVPLALAGGTALVGARLWHGDAGAAKNELENFYLLGRRLRTVHLRILETASPTVELDELAGRLRDDDRLAWLDELRPGLRRRLRRWLAELTAGDRPSHPELTLARLGRLVDAEDGYTPPLARYRAHPALDVARLLGDLTDLSYRLQLRGDDPGPVRSLSTAFIAGYRQPAASPLDTGLGTRLDTATVVRLVSLIAAVPDSDQVRAIYRPLLVWLVDRAMETAPRQAAGKIRPATDP